MRGAWFLVQYFGVVIAAILLLLPLGFAVKKIMPKTYSLLTGGKTS